MHNSNSMNGTTQQEPGYLSRVRQGLITHEDPFHVHKTLGLLCLLSFFMRFLNFPNMCFDSHPEWTVPTLLLHLLLNVSSFEFKLPQKRIKDGSRLWPEARLHSITFVGQTLALIFLHYYEQKNTLKPMYWMNVVIHMCQVFFADVGTWVVGSKYHSNTIRDIDAPGFSKFLFSFLQFKYKATAIYGEPRNPAAHYNVLWTLQSTAVIATLARKHLINPSYTFFIYLFQLVYLACLGLGLNSELPYVDVMINQSIMCTAAILRMGPRLPGPLKIFQSRYVMWPLIGLVVNYSRPDMEGRMPEGGPTEEQVKLYFRASVAGVVALAFWRIPRYPKYQNPAQLEDVKGDKKSQ